MERIEVTDIRLKNLESTFASVTVELFFNYTGIRSYLYFNTVVYYSIQEEDKSCVFSLKRESEDPLLLKYTPNSSDDYDYLFAPDFDGEIRRSTIAEELEKRKAGKFYLYEILYGGYKLKIISANILMHAPGKNLSVYEEITHRIERDARF